MKKPQTPSPQQNENTPPPQPEPIRVDGFEQVLEMLKIADPAFRESLLKRLAARDLDLARSLRAELSQ